MTRKLFALHLALLCFAAASPGEIDPQLLSGLRARAIGPAGMSGRLASIEAVESDPNVIYLGAATGGVWKSINAGLTWEPIFDDQPVAAIGAVAVFQANPDIVWIGTGEGSPRNSVSVGNGVYRSLDGGRTWSHLGLEGSERIHRIRLHPTNPDIAYVAALGQMWGENPERGVFRTSDGGRRWEKVLFVDEKTGAADLVMDPVNPAKLIAAMWQYRRWPWFFESGGPGSGLHVTFDGGDTWKKLTSEDGLPEGNLGRIGVDICRSQPEVIYALVEAEQSALLRSSDGGRTWLTANSEPDVANRPFYYADIRCDPAWPNRVYDLASRVRVSDDNGKSLEVLGESTNIHGDYQAMWINPSDPRHILIGNDGGMAVSRDRGATWRFVANLPLAQYYHIAVDMETPYNVYGGMQDNGSWRGPSSVRATSSHYSSPRGISNWHWVNVGGGDGFDTRPDPADANRGYSMSQGGYLDRWNLITGESKSIRPPQPGDEELRFNWNAPLAIDPFDPATLYYGSQFVHKSTDRGDTWSVISPDLTTNNQEWQKQEQSGGLTPDVTGAENYTTLVALAPSPIAPGVIWAGSDDGRLHLTRDGGQTWTSLEDRIAGPPANTWIPHITASTHEEGEAFVVFDDHRRSNLTPYVLHSTDFGRTWRDIVRDPVRGYALTIDQDPVDPDLLFLGTEFGLWFSTDRGDSWLPFRAGVPTVSVMDLVIHPRDHDLVLGTHGRAAFVIDDISPLRELDEVAELPLHLFPISPARQFKGDRSREGYGLGSGAFRGENRPYGATINLWLADESLPHPDAEIERARASTQEPASTSSEEAAGEEESTGTHGAPEVSGAVGEVTIEIHDSTGALVRELSHQPVQGLNRVVWDLGREPYKRPPIEGWSHDGSGGPEVRPGSYTVTVNFRDHSASHSLEVIADPHVSNTEADWQAREDFITRTGNLYAALTAAVERIDQTRGDLEAVIALAERERPEGDDAINPHQELIDASKATIEELTVRQSTLRSPPKTKGIVRRSDLLWELSYASSAGSGYWTPPTPTDLAYLEGAEARLRETLDELDRYYSQEVAGLRARFVDSELTLLPPPEPLKIP